MNKEAFTPEEVAAALRSAFGVIGHAAQLLGCTPGTVKNYMNRYPEVDKARRDAKEHLLDLAEHTLFKRALESPDNACLIFLLRTQGRGRGYGSDSESAKAITNGRPVVGSIAVQIISPTGNPDGQQDPPATTLPALPSPPADDNQTDDPA